MTGQKYFMLTLLLSVSVGTVYGMEERKAFVPKNFQKRYGRVLNLKKNVDNQGTLDDTRANDSITAKGDDDLSFMNLSQYDNEGKDLINLEDLENDAVEVKAEEREIKIVIVEKKPQLNKENIDPKANKGKKDNLLIRTYKAADKYQQGKQKVRISMAENPSVSDNSFTDSSFEAKELDLLRKKNKAVGKRAKKESKKNKNL